MVKVKVTTVSGTIYDLTVTEAEWARVQEGRERTPKGWRDRTGTLIRMPGEQANPFYGSDDEDVPLIEIERLLIGERARFRVIDPDKGYGLPPTWTSTEVTSIEVFGE